MPKRPYRTWFALVPAMLLPFALSLLYFVFMSDNPVARVLYGGTKVFQLLWPVFCFWVILGTPLPKVRLRSGKTARSIPLALLSGGGIVLIMILLMQTPLGEMVEGSSGEMESKARELGVLEHYIPFALFLALVHSLLEEYYWRWFVYGRLREVTRPSAAHLLGGLSFALHHVVICSQFFPLFWSFLLGGLVGVGGILWSLLYQRQGTLLGAWVSHILVDLGILGIGYTLLF